MFVQFGSQHGSHGVFAHAVGASQSDDGGCVGKFHGSRALCFVSAVGVSW